jgi:hypothetical protein
VGATSETSGRRDSWPLLALGAWSVLSWGGRVRNILEDAELTTAGRAAWLVPAVVFVLGGAVTLLAWWRAPASLRPGGLRSAVVAFAVWTIAYWALRMVLLVGNGHSAGFVAVHAVLAVVAATLAVATLARLRRRPAGRLVGGIPVSGAR